MELEEAEAAYEHAKRQRDKWAALPPTGFRTQQVELWQEAMDKVAWCLPGASGLSQSD